MSRVSMHVQYINASKIEHTCTMHILYGECVQYGCDILYDNVGTIGGNQKQAEAGGNILYVTYLIM